MRYDVIMFVVDLKSSTPPPSRRDLRALPSGDTVLLQRAEIATLITHLLLSWTCIDMASLLLGSSRRSVILHVHAVSPAVVPGTCGTEKPGLCHLLALQNSYLSSRSSKKHDASFNVSSQNHARCGRHRTDKQKRFHPVFRGH